MAEYNQNLSSGNWTGAAGGTINDDKSSDSQQVASGSNQNVNNNNLFDDVIRILNTSSLVEKPDRPKTPAIIPDPPPMKRRKKRRRRTVTTTTSRSDSSTTTTKYEKGIVDVSILPYMRHLEADFVASGLRPNRRVWFFFDDINVTACISKANEIELSSNGATVVTVNSSNALINASLQITDPPPIHLHRHGHSERLHEDGNTENRIEKVHVYKWNRRTDDSRGNSVLKYGPHTYFGNFEPGMRFKGEKSSANGTVLYHIVNSSRVVGSNNSWITLDRQTKHVPNNWWGTDNSNTVYIVSGHKDYGQIGNYRTIMGFDNVSLKLYVGKPFDYPPLILPPIGETGPIEDMPSIVFPNTTITIGKTGGNDENGMEFYTDNEGMISGTFHIPEGIFRIGERVFKIIDNTSGIEDECTTYAKYIFAAQGLKTRVEESLSVTTSTSTVKTRSTSTTTTTTRPRTPPTTTTSPPPPPPTVITALPPPPVQTPLPPPPPPPPPFVRPDGWRSSGSDPLAQTFFVDDTVYPDGLFLTSVDLWFRNKDSSAPVKLEIRPVNNGYPDSDEVIPGSTVIKYPTDVAISDNPIYSPVEYFDPLYEEVEYFGVPRPINIRADYTNGKTKFSFKNPVYLTPGEYAFVVITDSREYELWVSEVGEKTITSGQLVSEQPYIGSLFRSQNASTWTPGQLEDIMFALNKAVFPVNREGKVYMRSKKAEANTNADKIMVKLESTPMATSANIKFELADNFTNDFFEFEKDTILLPTSKQRQIIEDIAPGYFNVKCTLITTNRDISPVIVKDRNSIVVFENHIDNASLSAQDIVIVNPGTGNYVPNANIELTITSNTGIGAEGYAIANTSNSRGIDYVIITNEGYGYTDESTIVVLKSGDANAVGTGQTFSVIAETSPSGGSAQTKYISRLVTLNNGFDASDLKVFLTAYKPSTSDIKVYYKIKNQNDSDKFENKDFVLMKQKTLQTVYSTDGEVYEYQFEPFVYPDSISYSTNSTTYKTFNQFQIKIILISDNPTDPPILKDLRAIALPGQEF